MKIYTLVTILEVLCINTYTIYKCSKRRGSKFVTLFTLGVVIIAAGAGLLPVAPSMTDIGNGLFMLFGLAYIVPLYLLFAQPVKHLIIVMSCSLIYTMLAFSFSFRVGTLLSMLDLGLSVVLVQTVFFALTLSYYIKFVNNIFMSILKNIDKRMIDFLLVISLSWFFIIFLANYIFADGNSNVMDLIILIVVLVNAILSYKLFYKIVSVNTRAKELSHITKIDTLTQLKNREGFYEDVHQKMHSKQNFSIVFADLDNFKSINDTFGHAAGDMYLLAFVGAVNDILDKNDRFYRLHGDEFVFLVDSLQVEALCKALSKLKYARNPNGLTFKGLSLGYSTYPADGDNLSELLYVADSRMYQKKKEKHKK